MSSLHLLATKCETGIAFTSLLLLVQQHVHEGHFTIPSSSAAPASSSSSASSSVPKSAATEGPALQSLPPPPPPPTPSTTANVPKPLTATDVATASVALPPSGVKDHTAVASSTTATAAAAGGTRSVGGIVAPPSPYTAFRKPHMRRPNSATQRSASATPTPPPAREVRRLEYVDRWLEKLYFRNPVVVSTTSRPASPQVGGTSYEATMPPNGAAPTSSVPKGNPTQPQQRHLPTSYDEQEEETVVAMLPPKPAGRNAEVWREMMHEKLVSCFESAGSPHAGGGSGGTNHSEGFGSTAAGRPPLRASSARPGSATHRRQAASPQQKQAPPSSVVMQREEEEGRVDASLPNVSKFVAKKRMLGC